MLAHGLRVIHYDWLVSASRVEARVKRAAIDVHGSNEWAIAPSHSANGHSMLLSNSHLEWGDMHTYFEVQLTAPGVTSYGAVWVGFPVLRQCFTDYLGWTQTTNNPNGADLYQPHPQGRRLRPGRQSPPVRSLESKSSACGRRTAHCGTSRSPSARRYMARWWSIAPALTIALRVTALDRPRMFEQFWKMGLAHNLAQFQDAMRMQQLPLFNTAYADRDGHIMYLYNAARSSPLSAAIITSGAASFPAIDPS